MQRAKLLKTPRFSLSLGVLGRTGVAKPRSAYKQYCHDAFKTSKVFINKADLKQQWESLDDAKKQQLIETQAAKRKVYNSLILELRKEKAMEDALELCSSKIKTLQEQLDVKPKQETPKKKPISAFKIFRAKHLAGLKGQDSKMTRRERLESVRMAWGALTIEEKQTLVETSRGN